MDKSAQTCTLKETEKQDTYKQELLWCLPGIRINKRCRISQRALTFWAKIISPGVTGAELNEEALGEETVTIC